MSATNFLHQVESDQMVLKQMEFRLLDLQHCLSEKGLIYSLHLHIPVGDGVDLPALRNLVSSHILHATFSIEYLNSADMAMFAAMLAEILRHNENITTVSLRGCSLGNFNVLLLIQAIVANHSSKVHTLDLSDNFLTNEAADTIIGMLMHSCAIKTICLDDNKQISESKLIVIDELLARNQRYVDASLPVANAYVELVA